MTFWASCFEVFFGGLQDPLSKSRSGLGHPQGGIWGGIPPLLPKGTLGELFGGVWDPIRHPRKGFENKVTKSESDATLLQRHPKTYSKSVNIVSAACFGRDPLSSAKQKVEKVTLSKTLRRVHSNAIAQFSHFPSNPQKYPNWQPKALEMEARCSQKPLRRGSQKKRSKHVTFVVAFGVQMLSQMELNIYLLCFFMRFSIRPGLAWPLGSKCDQTWSSKSVRPGLSPYLKSYNATQRTGGKT